MNWRRVRAANDRLEWVAKNLGATFLDPNSWVDDREFSRDGLHLNWRGTGQMDVLGLPNFLRKKFVVWASSGSSV